MAIVNHAKKEINAKIVYYGPPGSGKSTSLQYVFGRIKPVLRGELKRSTTGGDELLFFDFSPFEAPLKHGYTVRFHLYTLTGPVRNPATWKMLLKGADGVVIQVCAAPQFISAAKESVSCLRELLSAYGVGLRDIAVTLQCNSDDSAVLPMKASVIAAELDLGDAPTHNSASVSGEGVLEAFSTLSRMVLASVEDAVHGSNGRQRIPKHVVAENNPEFPEGYQGDQSGETYEDSSAPAHLEAKPEISLECGTPAVHGTTIRIPVDIFCGNHTRRVMIAVSIEV